MMKRDNLGLAFLLRFHDEVDKIVGFKIHQIQIDFRK